jgi:hypothetical protein
MRFKFMQQENRTARCLASPNDGGKCRVADTLSTSTTCGKAAALSRFTLHFRAAFLTLVLACGTPGAFAKDKKATPAPAPPQPIPQKLKVLRDSAVDIKLQIYGRKNQAVTYVIRRPPAGKLNQPKNVELEAAVVQYKAPADQAITTDSFEYAAKSDLGVSATALVSIEIIDLPAELIAPVEITFGPVLTGIADKQTFEIENHGGTVAEGDLFVGAPWRIEVSPHYRLDPGQRRSVAITFAPDKPGEFISELRFSSQSNRVTNLRGKALAALEARPKSLQLEAVSGAPIRAAGLEIVNHTSESQTIRVTGSSRITTDAPLTLGPGQSGTIMVRTNKDDVRPLKGELILESDAHRTVVPIQASALPGVLQPETTSLELRAENPGGEPVADLLIRNLGGEPASGDISADAEFKVSINKINLPAGAESRVRVHLVPGINPPIEGSVYIKSGGHFQRVAIVANGAPGSSVPTPKHASKRSSSKSPSPEPERSQSSYQWSPYETDPTAPIDPVNIIRTVAMSPTSCTLEWHADRSPATKFIAESRELKIENHQLAMYWHSHRAFRVERIGNHFRGTIEQLQPSRMYTFRVRGLDAQGEPGPAIFEASVSTRPPESHSTKGTWTVVMIVVAIAAGAFLWFRHRLRTEATPPIDPTKTQRIV